MAISAQSVRAGKAYVELGVHDKLMRGLRRAQARLRAFGAGVQQIGMRLAKVAAMMAVPFALGAKAYATFDQQMRMVSTMLGDAAGKWMPIFSKAAKRMSIEFGQSIESIAKGMYDLLSAQVPPAQMLGVLRAAMKAATGGMTDTAVAVKAVVRIMRGFGVGAERAVDITDVLAMIVEKGVLNFEELAESIGTVAPSAKAAGMTLESLAGAVSTMVSVLEPKVAMTALRTAIFEAAEAGMDLLGFVRKFRGADLGTIIKAGIPKKAAQGIVILAQNLELLDKNIAAMGERAGLAQKKYEQMAGGLMYSWNQMKAAARVIFINIGKAIEKPLAAAAESVKKWSKIIGDFIARNRGLIASIAKVVTIGLAAGVSLMVLGFAIGKIAALLTLVKVAIYLLVPGAVALKVAIFALAHPILLVVGGLAVLGATLAWFTGYAGKAFKWLGVVFEGLKQDALNAFDGIKGALAAGDVGLAAKILWLGLKLQWEKGTHALLEVWSEFWLRTQVAGNLVLAGLKGSWATYQDTVMQGWIAFTAGLSHIWTIFTTGLAAAWAWCEKILTKGWNRLKAIWDKTFDVKVADEAADEAYKVAAGRIKAQARLEHNIAADLYKARMEFEKKRFDKAIINIGKTAQRGINEVDKDYKNRIARSKDALARARADFEKAVEEGKAAGAAPGAPPKPGEPPSPKDIAEKLRKAMADLPKTLAAGGVAARGTFGARALQSLLGTGGNTAERTATACERIAKNTKLLPRTRPLTFT